MAVTPRSARLTYVLLAVAGDVAGDGGDAVRDQRVEVAAVGLAQPVEGVVLEDLLAGTFGGARALAVAYQQDESAVGHPAQQSFDECGADETGGTGDGDPFPRQRRSNHS